VTGIDVSRSQPVEDVAAFFIERFEYDATGTNLLYFGRAKAGGTADNQGAWQIKKFTYDASNNLTSAGFPGGDNSFVYRWTDRALYNYA
jgi:hypothetical protein